MIDPEIIWETTQAKLVIVRYTPRIPPIGEFLEKSSMNTSRDAITKLLEMKYKMKAEITTEFFVLRASMTREIRNKTLNTRVVVRLPRWVKTLGISSMPNMVRIEARI
jgi:hypothetical protein